MQVKKVAGRIQISELGICGDKFIGMADRLGGRFRPTTRILSFREDLYPRAARELNRVFGYHLPESLADIPKSRSPVGLHMGQDIAPTPPARRASPQAPSWFRHGFVTEFEWTRSVKAPKWRDELERRAWAEPGVDQEST